MFRKITRLRLAAAALLLILCAFRRHLHNAVLLALEPLIFTYGDRSFELSLERDDFDITFSRYPLNPHQVALNESSLIVPPIIHHILLGKKEMLPGWIKAGESCKEQHPDYRFEFWDDERANTFVEKEYPGLYPMWKGYPYVIQRADSLRYMILYKHGGIFLDLDLHCRRPLDPLRRFEFVAPAAFPAGVSNGFMMAKPHSDFMARILDNLPKFDLSWFGLPYLTVSFSTGCHYLSTIHATTTTNRSKLKVLGGGETGHLHQLNGNASTPLFHHLGSSSWHSYDAALFKMIRKPEQWAPKIQQTLVSSNSASKTFAGALLITFFGGLVCALAACVVLTIMIIAARKVWKKRNRVVRWQNGSALTRYKDVSKV